MKTYEEVLCDLREMRDEKFRRFNERIVNVAEGSSIGVRIPLLRGYVKQLVKIGISFDELFSFPNDVYEIRLLKCLFVCAVRVDYAELVRLIERVLPVLDGWAVCDLFCSGLKQISRHRAEFYPVLQNIFERDTEFSARFVYVLMLGCYMTEEYLPQMFLFLDAANADRYYEHMGAAWLLAREEKPVLDYYLAGNMEEAQGRQQDITHLCMTLDSIPFPENYRAMAEAIGIDCCGKPRRHFSCLEGAAYAEWKKEAKARFDALQAQNS